MARRLVRNAASNFGGYGVHLVIGFFLFPFIVHHIGATAYGILILANAVVGYSGLLQLGLGPTVVKRGAEHLAAQEIPKLRVVLDQILTIYCLLSLALILVIAGCIWLLPSVFDLGDNRLLFRYILAVVGIQAAISFPMTVWGSLVESLEAYHVANAISVASAIARLVLTVALLTLGFGLLALVVAQFVIRAGQWLVTWWWVRGQLPGVRPRLVKIPWREAKPLFRFSGAMFLTNIGGTLEKTSDKLVIGILAPPALITMYEVGDRLNSESRGVFTRVLSILMPMAAALEARSDRGRLQKLFITLSRSAVAVYGFVFLSLVLYGREFISLWMGEEFSGAYAILLALTAASFSQANNAVAGSLARGMGRLRVLTWVVVARAVINVPLSVILLRQYGIFGVALATMVVHFTADIILALYYSRLFAVRVPELLSAVHLKALIALLPYAVVAISLKHFLGPIDSWGELVPVVAAGSLVFMAAFWTYTMGQGEKLRLRTAVRSWRSALSY